MALTCMNAIHGFVYGSPYFNMVQSAVFVTGKNFKFMEVLLVLLPGLKSFLTRLAVIVSPTAVNHMRPKQYFFGSVRR